jgi:hypothetical protein
MGHDAAQLRRSTQIFPLIEPIAQIHELFPQPIRSCKARYSELSLRAAQSRCLLLAETYGTHDAFASRCADQGLIFASFLASAARARRVS